MSNFSLSYFDQKKNTNRDFIFDKSLFIDYDKKEIISLLKKNDFSNIKAKKDDIEYDLSEAFIVKVEVVLKEKIDLFFAFDTKVQNANDLISAFNLMKEESKSQPFRSIKDKYSFVLDKASKLNPIFGYTLQYIDLGSDNVLLEKQDNTMTFIMPSSDYSTKHLDYINSGVNNNVARYNILCSVLVAISFFSFVFSLFFKNFVWILSLLFFFVSIVLLAAPYKNGLDSKDDFIFSLSKKNYYKFNLYGVLIGAVVATLFSFIFFSKFILQCLFSLFISLVLSLLFYVVLISIFNKISRKKRKMLFFDATKIRPVDEKDFFEATI